MVFLSKIRKRGRGCGGEGGSGGGPAKEPASQCASFVENYPLAISSIVSTPLQQQMSLPGKPILPIVAETPLLNPPPPRQFPTLYRAMRPAIRIRIRIVRCQRPAKRQKHKHCETQAHLSSPLLLVGSKELVLKNAKTRAISRLDSCDKKALRFVCPSCTRDTDGMAAKTFEMRNR